MSSAFLLEHRTAAAAGNGDLSFSLGNAQLLGAAGTLEINVVFIPVDGATHPIPADDRLCHLSELGVLFPALGEIPGKHPEQTPHNSCKRKQVQKRALKQGAEQREYHIGDQQKIVEHVTAVPAIHKTLQGVSNHRDVPPWG